MRPLDPSLLQEWQRRSAGRKPERRRSAPDGKDRRSHPRIALANTEMRDHSLSARVIDLSRLGFAIESHAALRPGGCYYFTLTIGEHVEAVEARVLWCRLLRTERLPNGDVRPTFRAGIERLPTDPSESPGS